MAGLVRYPVPAKARNPIPDPRIFKVQFPDLQLLNNAEGGTGLIGTTVTQGVGGNSGGASGNFFDLVTIGTGATLTFDNLHRMHGGAAYAFATAGTASQCNMSWQATISSVAGDSITLMYWRVYVYMSAFTNSPMIVRMQSSLSNDICRISFNTSGNLRILNAAAAVVATSTTVITAGTWIRVEGWTRVGSTGDAEIKIFTDPNLPLATPTETLTASAQNFGTEPIGWWQVGQASAVANIPQWWGDDVGISNRDWLGPVPPDPVPPAPVISAGLNPKSGSALVLSSQATPVVVAATPPPPVITWPARKPVPAGLSVQPPRPPEDIPSGPPDVVLAATRPPRPPGSAWVSASQADPVVAPSGTPPAPVIATAVRRQAAGSALVSSSDVQAQDLGPAEPVISTPAQPARRPGVATVVQPQAIPDSTDSQPDPVTTTAGLPRIRTGSAVVISSQADPAPVTATPPPPTIAAGPPRARAGASVTVSSQADSTDSQPDPVVSAPATRRAPAGGAVVVSSASDFTPPPPDVMPTPVVSTPTVVRRPGSAVTRNPAVENPAQPASPPWQTVTPIRRIITGSAVTLRPTADPVVPPPQAVGGVTLSGYRRPASGSALTWGSLPPFVPPPPGFPCPPLVIAAGRYPILAAPAVLVFSGRNLSVECETFPPFTGRTDDDLVLTGRPANGSTGDPAGMTARPSSGLTVDPC